MPLSPSIDPEYDPCTRIQDLDRDATRVSKVVRVVLAATIRKVISRGLLPLLLSALTAFSLLRYLDETVNGIDIWSCLSDTDMLAREGTSRIILLGFLPVLAPSMSINQSLTFDTLEPQARNHCELVGSSFTLGVVSSVDMRQRSVDMRGNRISL